MNLKPIAANMTEIETKNKRVLFSYKTAVAYYDTVDQQFYETEKKWSVTTTRHINKWVGGYPTKKVGQDVLDGLLNEVK